jgi:hypothetical protein
LAARRVRDKKARDHLEDSYIKKLIRKAGSDLGPDFLIRPEIITIKRFGLVIRRLAAGRFTPEMRAAFDVHAEEYERKRDGVAA